jgi:hypothetical protein
MDVTPDKVTYQQADKVAVPTPQNPDELVQLLATVAKQHTPPLVLAAGFPGVVNEQGTVMLAANLPQYAGYPLVDKLVEAIGYDNHPETKGYRPLIVNDMQAQAAGLPNDGRHHVIIALGTGAGNGLGTPTGFQGGEFGHAPYTTRGQYPLSNTTYEQVLCNVPAVLGHHIQQTVEDLTLSKKQKSSVGIYSMRDFNLATRMGTVASATASVSYDCY